MGQPRDLPAAPVDGPAGLQPARGASFLRHRAFARAVCHSWASSRHWIEIGGTVLGSLLFSLTGRPLSGPTPTAGATGAQTAGARPMLALPAPADSAGPEDVAALVAALIHVHFLRVLELGARLGVAPTSRDRPVQMFLALPLLLPALGDVLGSPLGGAASLGFDAQVERRWIEYIDHLGELIPRSVVENLLATLVPRVVKPKIAMSTTPATFSISDLARRLQDGARQLEQQFLGKEEIIRLLFISALAGEHMVMVGPPGTAKSAIVRAFAQVIDARFFDYLLTRFTEPNEIFGPVDIQAFRQGTYRRRIEKMLPEAEVVFLDEIFKANSAILNSLLTLVNARRFTHGTSTVRVPLISLFAASNEVPTDEALSAIFDRFLLRVRCDYLDSYHFRGLLQKGIQLEVQQMADQQVGRKVATAAELLTIQRDFGSHVKMSEEFSPPSRAWCSRSARRASACPTAAWSSCSRCSPARRCSTAATT
ncbi:AAA family ATPase [Nannocystis pusilla]|uniref:AAA family ATPase n=1 Tax=Nannocystis pusilla TaxID=889268 RepID=UPI003B818CE9